MLDVTVIILTLNEELHIRRCLEKVAPIAKKIYVIDCHSTDRTVEFAESLGATVVPHNWPGNQAEQFNWALDNIDVSTEWILRLDADEYLSDELISELEATVPNLPSDISALVFPLGRAFMGRVLKHGIVNNVSMIRMFRRGKAIYEQRIMDEHLKVLDGKAMTLKHKFIDDNRTPLSHFVKKHNSYAEREAAILLAADYNLDNYSRSAGSFATEVSSKRNQKALYNRLPLFWRSFAYFIYRYVIKLGFLDGKEGFLWDFLQGLWYRTLVDAKVLEIKKACGNDKEKIRRHLQEHYGISL